MARDRLLGDEIELRRATERVAAARRALPPGGAVREDYVFQAAGSDGLAGHVGQDMGLAVVADSPARASARRRR